MNGTRTMLAVVLSLVLVLSALPAGAVSYIGQWCRQQINEKDVNAIQMTPRNTTFCFLSSVGFENTDTTGERATCRVYRGAVAWELQAVLNQDDDADAYCCAICF